MISVNNKKQKDFKKKKGVCLRSNIENCHDPIKQQILDIFYENFAQ